MSIEFPRNKNFKRKYAKPASHVIFAFVSHHSVYFQQKLSVVDNLKKRTAKKAPKSTGHFNLD